MNEGFAPTPIPEKTWPGKDQGLPPPMTPEFGYTENTPSSQESKLPPSSLDSNFDFSKVPPLPQEKPNEPVKEIFEGVSEQPKIPILERDLMYLGTPDQQEKRLEFINELRDLSSEAAVELYHGLNGGLEKALAVLESPDQGVKQISGPCLAVFPVGQFWKPGDVGFKYSIPRGKIEFPGESNPDAQFRVDEGGSVLMINNLESLPLSEYSGEVMRTTQKEDVTFEKMINGEMMDVPGQREVPLTREQVEVAKKIEEAVEKFSRIRELLASAKELGEKR